MTIDPNYTFLSWAVMLFGTMLGVAFIAARYPRGEVVLHAYMAFLSIAGGLAYVQYIRPVMAGFSGGRVLLPDAAFAVGICLFVSIALYQATSEMKKEVDAE